MRRPLTPASPAATSVRGEQVVAPPAPPALVFRSSPATAAAVDNEATGLLSEDYTGKRRRTPPVCVVPLNLATIRDGVGTL